MDITWITERIALGGGIWNARNMEELARFGLTHVINMQIEFDDRPLAEPLGIRVLWNPVDDDFLPKPAALLARGVDFALEALQDPRARLYIHCAAGVHRAPMMTLAVLCAQEWGIEEAMALIEGRRPVVDFADVYVASVRRFLETRVGHGAEKFGVQGSDRHSGCAWRKYARSAPLGRAAFLLFRARVVRAHEERNRNAQIVRRK